MVRSGLVSSIDFIPSLCLFKAPFRPVCACVMSIITIVSLQVEPHSRRCWPIKPLCPLCQLATPARSVTMLPSRENDRRDYLTQRRKSVRINIESVNTLHNFECCSLQSQIKGCRSNVKRFSFRLSVPLSYFR